MEPTLKQDIKNGINCIINNIVRAKVVECHWMVFGYHDIYCMSITSISALLPSVIYVDRDFISVDNWITISNTNIIPYSIVGYTCIVGNLYTMCHRLAYLVYGYYGAMHCLISIFTAHTLEILSVNVSQFGLQ